MPGWMSVIIARHVNRARKEQAFDPLVVVAPSQRLGNFRSNVTSDHHVYRYEVIPQSLSIPH
jgi:hypothetical protein